MNLKNEMLATEDTETTEMKQVFSAVSVSSVANRFLST